MRWQVAQWFELQWWKRYLGNQTPEAYLAWKADYWRGFLDELNLDLPENCIALDAGCGPAGIFCWLTCKKIYAVDPLIDLYASNLPHFQPQRYPNTIFIQSKIEEMELAEQVDVAFCLNVINHVDHLNKAYDALVNAVKPSGTLVLSIDAHNFNGIKRLFRFLPLDILHPHQYDLEEYKKALSMWGIVIEKSVLYRRGFIFNYYVLVGKKM